MQTWIILKQKFKQKYNLYSQQIKQKMQQYVQYTKTNHDNTDSYYYDQ